MDGPSGQVKSTIVDCFIGGDKIFALCRMELEAGRSFWTWKTKFLGVVDHCDMILIWSLCMPCLVAHTTTEFLPKVGFLELHIKHINI